MVLSDKLLSGLSEFVASRMGLHFPEERWKDLKRGLASAAKEFQFDDAESCAKWLISSTLTEAQTEVLARHLTVGETYFFRDKECFDALAGHVLPELIVARRKAGKYLRIWSAGCCTGEEPYSIAILLKSMLRDLQDWNITILATDLNPAFLKKAEAGIYGQWSFRNTPKWVREGYFKETEGKLFELVPEIRDRVTFAYHNLAENSYPSLLSNTNAMDLILCRNVLMYFTQDHQRFVVRKLHQCLVDGGCLIVSPSEAYDALFSGFTRVNLHGSTLYRKGAGAGDQIVQSTIINQPSSIPPAWSSGCPAKAADGVSSIVCRQSTKKQDTLSSIAIYEEALLLYEKGNYDEAAEKLIPLLSDNGHEGKAAALLARIAANRGSLSAALDLCGRAVSSDRCEPSNYYLLATILQEQGKMEDAAAELKRALYLDQDFVLAHFLLGTLSLRQGDKREATKHFRNALVILEKQRPEDLISRAEGITAGRLMAIIRSSVFEEVA